MFYYKLKETTWGLDDKRGLVLTTSACPDWVPLEGDQYAGIKYIVSQHPEYIFSEWCECEFLVYYRADETVPELKDFEAMLEADPEHWQKGEWKDDGDYSDYDADDDGISITVDGMFTFDDEK